MSTTAQGGAIDPTDLTRTSTTLLRKAGLRRIRFHGLRHSTATLLLEQGVGLVVSKELLGHAHIGVTATVYAHVRPRLQRDAIAALAPTLAEAVRAASTKAYVILDGTLPPIDRIAADRPFCSGKHKKHGMNVQVIVDPKGRPVWASPALVGAVHDVRAAREHGITEELAAAGITCWADKGYQGAGGTVRLPYRGRWDSLSTGRQAVNRSHAKIRALVEQAIAILKSWRLLRELRCSTTRITSLVQAVPVLQLAATDGDQPAALTRSVNSASVVPARRRTSKV
ncbi:hypothetical protein GCM10010421_64250 [Streptomyces glaucus]|uniref:Tyr recombinase domain-containing protein n=1 Tax=Streptomyces glaucus TaxID=284029 RepID=A0ABN3KM73_9ACTN